MEIEQKVIDKIIERQKKGMNKYGISVKDNELSTKEWLNHLQEELLDGAIYIEKIKDILDNKSQSQNSLNDQLKCVIALSNIYGFYDAYDYLKKIVSNETE